jgi:hypothetical protein
MSFLDVLKYLNELLPGILNFNQIGKDTTSFEVFMGAVENGFDNFQACNFPHNFDIIKFCDEKINDANYSKLIMKKVESLVFYGENEEHRRKIFFYLLDKGVPTSLTSESIAEILNRTEEYESEEKICATKFLRTDNGQPVLIQHDYPYDSQVGIL